MTIQSVPAHPNNYSPINTQKVGFVLHWIVGELEAADASFTNPNRKASAHYGIGSGGEVHQYVPDNFVAWHAGNWEANTKYIGIEHAGGQPLPGQPGNTSEAGRKKPTDPAHKASVELIVSLCRKLGITQLERRQNLWTHREISPTACPGSLDVDWIVNKVNQKLKPIVTPNPPQSNPTDYKPMLQDLVQKLKNLNVRIYNHDVNEDWLDNLEFLANKGDWQLFNTELASVLKMTQNEAERRINDQRVEILKDQVRKFQFQKLYLFNYDKKEDWGDNLESLANKGDWQLFNTELASILKMGQNEYRRATNQPFDQ